MWPDTTDTAPNSPIARALHNSTPNANPHRTRGRVTYHKTCQNPAPRVSAASSSVAPCASMIGISWPATNGTVTNIVHSTMPGRAKITLTPAAASIGPNQPWPPNSVT